MAFFLKIQVIEVSSTVIIKMVVDEDKKSLFISLRRTVQ